MNSLFAVSLLAIAATLPADITQKEGVTAQQWAEYAKQNNCHQVDAHMWVCEPPEQFKQYFWIAG